MPALLAMTVLQAAGMSKVPREREWRLRGRPFSTEMGCATRGRVQAETLESEERNIWKLQLDVECA
jgi:hypothetical protein